MIEVHDLQMDALRRQAVTKHSITSWTALHKRFWVLRNLSKQCQGPTKP